VLQAFDIVNRAVIENPGLERGGGRVAVTGPDSA
jgi:hypothetical protein